ncbi:MAG: DPP IV N-terminal domain-containing protein [Saprospiraceae bacterium]|nr:DPP IV N-terminal domain-containing protein [Saprospiraceae bacterium]MBP7699802.1 DPP IV N-terminal domain-containing protein [Saprospiraceae bacterium]
MSVKKIFSAGLLFLSACIAFAQTEITVEDIWKNGKFSGKYVEGFNFQQDGKHYTRLEDNRIVQYDLLTGKPSGTLLDARTLKAKNIRFANDIDSYIFSSDEKKILIVTETEPIYRHSFKANYFVWDVETQTLKSLFTDKKQMNATFSPQGDKVSFVSENNLYVHTIATSEVKQVTEDGAINKIINGNCDWVYEEEFSPVSGEGMKAIEWSPDGSKLAFLRFDESQVKEYWMKYYNGDVYPETYKFKYPKVGESNSVVTAHIYNIPANKVVKIDIGSDKDYYIPRIKWTNNENLCITKLNRHQNQLQLLLAGSNGKASLLMQETNKYFIDVNDALTFLDNGNFIWMSEQSGYNHLYLYDGKTGQQLQPLTKGDFDVTAFYGYDPKNKKIFYQAAPESPMTRHIYATSFEGKNPQQLTTQKGFNDAVFSSTFDYFVNTYSNINTPPITTVFDSNGKEMRIVEGNTELTQLIKEYNNTKIEFFDFTTSEGVKLNGWMIQPRNMDATKKHPLFMYQYSGPNSQEVLDQWIGMNYWWFQMLAQRGYVVACVDGRGTGARGEEFRKMTYKQLGKYEVIDQIEAAKYLGTKPYVDKSRIGIFGWSYGGFMAANCIFKGNDVFKSAISVAPVTNWKWYDTVYTERYMQTEQENPDGYKNNSPLYFADRLKGNFLLLHGVADDNVHFQNTIELTNALIDANKQFDTYFYPNRNHGIYGGNARLHLYNKMTNFVLEKL